MRTILRCAVCGEVIKPGRTPGTFAHVTRLVAACDMDSDHRPLPEGHRPAEGPADGPLSDGGRATNL